MAMTNIKAVELVRDIRNQHYEEIKDKTSDERIAFYRAKAQALHTKAQEFMEVQMDAQRQSNPSTG